MTTATSSTAARSARLGLRATQEQEVVLRRAAEVAHKSLTDFILDSACLAAEQTLLDQRLFMVTGSQYQALMDFAGTAGAAQRWAARPVRVRGALGGTMTLRSPESLGAHHRLEGFDCGKQALNEWLVRHARQAQAADQPRLSWWPTIIESPLISA